MSVSKKENMILLLMAVKKKLIQDFSRNKICIIADVLTEEGSRNGSQHRRKYYQLIFCKI